MERLKSGVEFIFSSYKRTAVILFIASLTLAIPISVTLVGHQQDIRQRADTGSAERNYDINNSPSQCAANWSACGSLGCSAFSEGNACGCDCSNIVGGSVALKEISTLSCKIKPRFCIGRFMFFPQCREPLEGWCETKTTPQPTPFPDVAAGTTCSDCKSLGKDYFCKTSINPSQGLCSSSDISQFNLSFDLSCQACPDITPTPTLTDSGVICTTDVFVCPNGSFVSRQGPNCNFAPCPTTTPTTKPTNTPTDTPTPTNEPTVTPTQEASSTTEVNTSIGLSIQLPGISQNIQVGHNPNPQRPQRTAQVALFDSQNRQILSTSGKLVFNEGQYSGGIVLGTNFTTGVYTVKLRLDNTLWKTVPGIYNIIVAQSLNLPPTLLVSGDINGDNELNLVDYSLLLSCYGNSQCEQKELADLNDDAKVDESDLNILYRGFAVRMGD